MKKQVIHNFKENKETERCISTEFVDIELLPKQPYEIWYKSDLPSVGFAFESQAGEHALGSDRTLVYKAKANSLAFVPANCDVYSYSETGGEYLKVTLKLSHEKAFENMYQLSNVVHKQSVKAAYKIRKLILTNHSNNFIFIEELITELCGVDLLTGVSGGCYTDPPQWITNSRVDTIEDYIEEHLDSQLSVTKLAKYFNLSAGFFSRDFKKAFGKSPHDYIVERRISRARDYLKSSESGLSEIAVSSGFSSHAHMTSVFQLRLGISPGLLRRHF